MGVESVGTPVDVWQRSDLHASLADPALESMNLLNEIANRFPEAISFAAGRPYEEFFDVEDTHRYLRAYCTYLAEEQGYDQRRINRTLLQYGRTKGLIHELVAENLRLDEGIEVDPESVVVTVGCQEAMVLTLRALRATDRDVLLAVWPTYVGITGAAQLVDMPVLPVRSSAEGIDLADLVEVIGQARQAGLRPRALYLVPEFANPTGVSLSTPVRRRLLEIAYEQGLLLLEDNPYGLFGDGTEHPPTLKSLDRTRQVVYLGSFAKTGMPGARVGYLVADQVVSDGQGGTSLLADELSKIKSMITVNTAPIAQAVIAGKLLENDGSLILANTREAEVYRRNLAQVLAGLAARFPADGPLGGRITWNVPTGGFFIVLTVPFTVNDDLLVRSAREYGVIWTPMHHFYGGRGGERQLRLSISVLDAEQIETGLDRLAALVAQQTAAERVA